MKNFTRLACFSLCFILSLSAWAQKDPQGVKGPNGLVRCLTTEMDTELSNRYPQQTNSKEQFEEWLAPKIEEFKVNQALTSLQQPVLTIPVVIHIIHDGDPINVAGGELTENISYAQAVSQVDVLNEDFRRLMGTPGAGETNYNAGVDVEIEFCLATQDPNGAASNGVNRVNLCQESWSTADIDDIVKPETIWDPTKYMNMWSVNFTNSSLLGYAQFPNSSGLGGLNTNNGPAETDGVVSNFNAFGTLAQDDGSFILNNTYNLGRTMTHEVGHYLGLRHIWGDGACNEDDFCDDTPNSDGANFGCAMDSSCGSMDMSENYMDYSDDACMNTFTEDQKTRMLTVMMNSPRRMELPTSIGCSAGTANTNDIELRLTCFTENICEVGFSPGIEIINKGNAQVTEATISYTVNGDAAQTYEFTGSLDQFEIASVNLPSVDGINGNNTINVSVTDVNGSTDEEASNNLDSDEYIYANNSVISEYNATTYFLELVTDDYGSETTYELTDASGNVLFEGGPYEDNTTINDEFTVENNECFQFTIFDSFGDGICCDYGDGSYSLTTGDGTVVIEGGEFDNSESVAFRANESLSVKENAFANFTIYPNPADNVLNISLNNTNELPETVRVFNVLGQAVVTKSVTNSSDLNVNVSSLQKGIYFVRIENETTSGVVKFVKN
jgi:hypothetical protein